MKALAEIKHILEQFLAEGREHEVVEFKEAKNQYDFEKIGKYFTKET